MRYELGGTHESDPLYRLLAEEDELEADEYASMQVAGVMQHNLRVEIEQTQGDAFNEFDLDEELMQPSTVEDSTINDLITYLNSKGA